MPGETHPTEPPIRALNELIRRAGAPDAMRSDLPAWLRAQGVDGDDLDALVSVGADRLLLYRRMVHSRLRNTIRDFIPRAAARLEQRYAGFVETWMDDQAATTPYLRDVPEQFVRWAVPRWEDDSEVPDYIPCLARHELLQLDVRNDPNGGESQTGNAVALDRPLRFDGAARRVDYAYAVHKLSADVEDRGEPDKVPTSLLVYRDETSKPRYLELTTFAAALLDRLHGHGEALQPALGAACAQLGEPLDDDKLSQAALLLADLAERGVMLGAE